MQHNDERPTVTGRPSLLSTEQQAEADRQRLLGGLDDNAPGAAGPRRKYSWLAAGLVTVVALGAGSALWMAGEDDTAIVVATTAALPASPAAPAPLASDPLPQLAAQDGAGAKPDPAAPANPEGDDVSTAAILEDAPVLTVKPAVPEVKKPYEDELTRLLDQPAPALVPGAAKPVVAASAVTKPDVDGEPTAVPAMVKLADKPVAKKMVIAKAAPPKPAPKQSSKAQQKSAQNVTPQVHVKSAQNVTPTVTRKGAPKVVPAKAEKHPLAVAPSNKKNEVHPKARTDNDVALLAALMAHSKATQPKRGSAAAEKLKQCKTLASVAEADECRARLCASSARNEAQCKVPGVVKASHES